MRWWDRTNNCTVNIEAKSLLKTNLENPCDMLFDENDVHTFCTSYARLEGFDIVRRSSNMT